MKTDIKIYAIPVSQIIPYENQPYQVRDDVEMEALAASIRENGILEPLKLRWIGTKEQPRYELISGHRRLHAANQIGLAKVPAHIYILSPEEAAIMLVDSNLHREHVLPSEKAKAYKLRLDARNRQGQRSGPSSGQVGQRWARDEMAEEVGESSRQIQRYIRLTQLIPDILSMVDDGKISMTPAVELSYLREQEQGRLLEIMKAGNWIPSLEQAQKLKQLSQAGQLDWGRISNLICQRKPAKKEYMKLRQDKYDRYLGGLSTPQEKEDFLLKALDHYTRYLHQQEQTRGLVHGE